jgi:hypothetical protein
MKAIHSFTNTANRLLIYFMEFYSLKFYCFCYSCLVIINLVILFKFQINLNLAKENFIET